MILVYLKVPEHDLVTEIAWELVDSGMTKEHIHAYNLSPRRAAAAPLQVNRYRSPSAAVIAGGAVGAFVGALVGLPFLTFGGPGIAPLLVLMVTGGLGGAVYRLWIGNGPAGELYCFDEALRRGETIMALEIEKPRMHEIQDKIQSRHPEVSVLGANLEGTPPFPWVPRCPLCLRYWNGQ